MMMVIFLKNPLSSYFCGPSLGACFLISCFFRDVLLCCFPCGFGGFDRCSCLVVTAFGIAKMKKLF